jgi:hypothetical protein
MAAGAVPGPTRIRFFSGVHRIAEVAADPALERLRARADFPLLMMDLAMPFDPSPTDGHKEFAKEFDELVS